MASSSALTGSAAMNVPPVGCGRNMFSPNDSTAVVSFAATAATALPLTAITSAGDYATARAAVAGIAFGGGTSIGAGLQQAAALLPPLGRRAIILLSDGFENAAPMASA